MSDTLSQTTTGCPACMGFGPKMTEAEHARLHARIIRYFSDDLRARHVATPADQRAGDDQRSKG